MNHEGLKKFSFSFVVCYLFFYSILKNKFHNLNNSAAKAATKKDKGARKVAETRRICKVFCYLFSPKKLGRTIVIRQCGRQGRPLTRYRQEAVPDRQTMRTPFPTAFLAYFHYWRMALSSEFRTFENLNFDIVSNFVLRISGLSGLGDIIPNSTIPQGIPW